MCLWSGDKSLLPVTSTECQVTWSKSNPVSFRVQEAADLSEFTVPLCLVLDGVGLHQEGVLARRLENSVHSISIAAGENLGFL